MNDPRFGLWIFAVDGAMPTFGYLIIREADGTIIRRVDKERSMWCVGLKTLDEFTSAIKARAQPHNDEYRLYRAPKVMAPLCTGSLLRWLWYIDGIRRGERNAFSLDEFCLE